MASVTSDTVPQVKDIFSEVISFTLASSWDIINRQVSHMPIRRNILERINESALKFLEPLSPEKTYATIVEEAVKLVGAKFGSILLERHGELERVYGSAGFTYQIQNRKRGNTYRAFKSQKTVVALIEELGKYHPVLKENGIKCTVFIPLSYQGKALGVLTINSVKKLKLTDEELRVLELLGSMASLAIRKVRLYKEMQDALKARDLFISMASHELKTPLTAINGYVDLLARKLTKSNSSESRWVKNLSAETHRLIVLVNELLQTSNIKTGKLQYVWKVSSIREIIRQVVNTFNLTHPDRIIYVSDELQNMRDNVTADFDKMVQVFSNIVNNAAKFSKPDTAIQVKLSYKDGSFYVEVTDQGKGIAAKDLTYIFDEFFKKSEDGIEGMGLGLFLVKKIVTEHKGEISVRSTVGKGTTFVVKLPEIKV